MYLADLRVNRVVATSLNGLWTGFLLERVLEIMVVILSAMDMLWAMIARTPESVFPNRVAVKIQ